MSPRSRLVQFQFQAVCLLLACNVIKLYAQYLNKGRRGLTDLNIHPIIRCPPFDQVDATCSSCLLVRLAWSSSSSHVHFNVHGNSPGFCVSLTLALSIRLPEQLLKQFIFNSTTLLHRHNDVCDCILRESSPPEFRSSFTENKKSNLSTSAPRRTPAGQMSVCTYWMAAWCMKRSRSFHLAKVLMYRAHSASNK